MTNYHVVQYADPKSGYSDNTVLEVFLPDGREAKGTFVGGDAKTDLAVVKIPLDNLPTAE
jgi:serine protease Do